MDSQHATLKTMSDEIADMYYQAIYAVVEPDGSESSASALGVFSV